MECEVFFRCTLQERGRDADSADSGDLVLAAQFGMVVNESAYALPLCRMADPVGHIDSEEIAWPKEAVDGVQIYVIRVHKVWTRPLKLSDGRIRRRACYLGLGADDRMLAV